MPGQPDTTRIRSGVVSLVEDAVGASVKVYETATKEQADPAALRRREGAVVVSVPGWRRGPRELAGQLGEDCVVYTITIVLVAEDYRSSTGGVAGCEELEQAIKDGCRTSKIATIGQQDIYLRLLRRDTVISADTAEAGGPCTFVITAEATEVYL